LYRLRWRRRRCERSVRVDVSDQDFDPVISLLVALRAEDMAQAALLGLLDNEERVSEVAIIRAVRWPILPAYLCAGDDDRAEVCPAALL